jgi:hypothetical protein
MPIIKTCAPQPTRSNRHKVNLVDQITFVELFNKSGMTQQIFCKFHNLNKSTFKNWVYRHKSNLKRYDDCASCVSALNHKAVFLPINFGCQGQDDPQIPLVTTTSGTISSDSTSLPPPYSPSIKLPNNCDHRITINCQQLTIQVPAGFDTNYLQTVLKIAVNL